MVPLFSRLLFGEKGHQENPPALAALLFEPSCMTMHEMLLEILLSIFGLEETAMGPGELGRL